MENLMNTLRKALTRVIEDIDTDNTNMSEEDMVNVITALQLYSHKEEYFTKYQACMYLNNMSRATFDNLVSRGKLPKGEKKYPGDNNLFWKVTDLMAYRKSMTKN